jgi:nitrous oxidase accessory protein NosD
MQTVFTKRTSMYRPALAVVAPLVLLLGALPAAGTPRHPGGGGPHAGTVVVVPPGNDQIAEALQRAGTGGTVVLQPGVHSESAPVLIEQPVTLAGEPGAILESASVTQTALPAPVDPALHVRGASDVRILGLEIRPAGGHGDTGVLIESSPSAVVAGNTIRSFANGILIEQGDGARIADNSLELDPTAPFGALGVTVINGRSAVVENNRVSNALFGIWACDRQGLARGNLVTNNLIGIILCKVPAASWLIGGREVGSVDSGIDWDVRDNVARGNTWGYLVIDGSHGSRLTNNAGGGNALYDIELSGDSLRFGFLTPTSSDTVVHTAGDASLVVKDCGVNNRVTGAATLVDTTADPCF